MRIIRRMQSLLCPRQMTSRRCPPCPLSKVALSLLIALSLWVMRYLYSSRQKDDLVNAHRKSKFVVDTPGCSIPDVNPFDESLKDIIQPGDLLVCDAKPALTYTDGHALRINLTALDKFYDDKLERCQYEKIIKPKGGKSDNVFHYSSPVDFTHDIEDTGTEFLRVACFGKSGRLLYANFHASVIIKKRNEVISKAKYKTFSARQKTENIFDFLILGVDSVSRLNFIRQMPKTRMFLEDTLKAVSLNGYNKVADNTFVNLSPMFAGKFTEELPWGDQNRETPFDNYSFVWKDAHSHGYRTLFAEDAPNIAIFNYDKPGFHKAPTDYYLRPFSLAVEDHASVWNTNHDCIGPKAETEVVLDYIYDFMKIFKGRPRFAFSFITRLTHEAINKAGSADEFYYKFFSKLYSEGLLHNTVILYYSDHGMRFGAIRETAIGQLEERLPFLYLSLPSYIRKRYPSYIDALRRNSHRLTTPFDIYTTLSSLLHFKGDIPENTLAKRSMNLLVDVPKERTCTDAAIHSHWCTCHRYEAVDIKSDIAQLSGITVVEHINNLLSSHGIACATLVLDEVTNARMIIANERMETRSTNLHDVLKDIRLAYQDPSLSSEYIITFRTNPGGALFEANVRKSMTERSLKVIGEISRINAYGDQSTCIQYFEHKKYCFCNE